MTTSQTNFNQTNSSQKNSSQANATHAHTGTGQTKPRFRTGQLMFGLGLVAIGVTGFASAAFGSPISTTLAAVVLAEAAIVFWLVKRNRRLLNAMIAAATPVSTLTGDAAGPDPELVRQAMAELDEIDAPSDPHE